MPFIEPLKALYSDCKAIDLGCGRGEWLELLKEIGVEAHGVDLDDGMLSACRELGLSVETGDAISYLKALPDESQVIVSGFHIAEHIPFASLQSLVQEALRVLKPAGLLILETPNPENIVVGTVNFYLDPTHQRPLPPLLLSFLPEHYGFCRTKILRLQESPELAANKTVNLLSVLNGVSPDYAIVAQKSAPDEQLAGFVSAFEKEYGLTLETLAISYDAQAETAAHQAQAILNLSQMFAAREQEHGAQVTQGQAEIQRLHQAYADRDQELGAQIAQGQAEVLRLTQTLATREQEQEQRALAAETHHAAQAQRIDELGSNSHHWQQQACALESERNALRQSWSWQITAPVRWAGGLAIGTTLLRSGANNIVRVSIATFHRPVTMLMRAVLRHPGLSYRINQRLMRYPALYQKILGVARQNGVIPCFPIDTAKSPQDSPGVVSELTQLTSRARRVYADLKAAIEKNREAR